VTRHILEDDIVNHQRFRARLKDRQFALDAYHFLRNAIMHDDGSRHSLSQRSTGEVIAELRGENEDYIDYYLSDMGLTAAELEIAGRNDSEIAELLSEVGWRVLTAEQEVALYREALDRLDVAEEKEPVETPHWVYQRFGGAFSVDDRNARTPYARLRFLAFTGRVDITDFDFVSAHITLSDQASSLLGNYIP
jgi:hypothetical protein